MPDLPESWLDTDIQPHTNVHHAAGHEAPAPLPLPPSETDPEETTVPQSPITFRDDPETRRITRVVQRAADAAFQTRVADALAAGYAAVDPARLERRRSDEGITAERWIELGLSTRNAESPEEFRAFARALSVSPRWLATGSGWMNEPPEGWVAFGTHVDEPEVPLVFSSEEDECLLPLWERPLEAVPA